MNWMLVVAMTLAAFATGIGVGIVVLDLVIKSGGGSVVLSRDGWLARIYRKHHWEASPSLCQVLLTAFGTVAGRIAMVVVWVDINAAIFVAIRAGYDSILAVLAIAGLNILGYALWRGIVRVGGWLPTTSSYRWAKKVERQVDAWQPPQMVSPSVRGRMGTVLRPLSVTAAAGVRIGGAPFILAATAYETIRRRACPVVEFK